jgi:hypothetical protein
MDVIPQFVVVVDAFIGKRYQRRPKQAAHQE